MSIIKDAYKPQKTKKNRMAREDAIVVTNDITSINECYNTLKDNLIYMCDSSKNKVIQIESSFSGEGKTTLTCNLAVSLSFNHKKVLVIDLDFRKPRIHRLFKTSNQGGLIDYISEKIPFDNLIKKTSYENVDVISRGSAIYNPSFLLTSERFKSLIEKLRGLYDFVLLDSPPVLQISDYIHISKVSDGALFAVAYGQTKKAQVIEAANLLKSNGVNVIGTVMTFVDKKDPYASYYGSYKERYGYDADNSKNLENDEAK